MIDEQVIEEFEQYYESSKLIKTLERMWKMRHNFNSVEDVESEIIQVLEYLKILNGLSKEIGLKKNELVELKRTEFNSKALKLHIVVNTKGTQAYSNFQTDSSRNKYVSLRCTEEMEPIKKIESDYNVILDFINDQKWTIKSYLAELQERRKYHVAIKNIENKV